MEDSDAKVLADWAHGVIVESLVHVVISEERIDVDYDGLENEGCYDLLFVVGEGLDYVL